MQSQLPNFIQEKILSLWSHQLWNSLKNYTYLKYIKLNFTFYIYAFLGRITVEKHVNRRSSVVHITKICCAIVIMHNL